MSREFRRNASLLLNVVLGAALAALVLHKLERVPSPSPAGISPEKMTDEVKPVKVANEGPAVSSSPKLGQYTDFTSASDRRRWLIDQMRAMGVPNDTLALIARMDLEAQWDGRFRECWGEPDKMAAVQLQMDMSKDAEMRAALGEAGFKQWDQKNMLWEAMSTAVDVTPSEAEGIYALKKKLQQRELELEQARVNGTMDDAELKDATERAYSEYNQQLKTLLGDSRYAVSQQTDDAFRANLLSHQLASVNPSDSQFQELFKAQQQWIQSLSQLDPSATDYAAQYKALNDARDQTYQRVLGSNVYSAYQEQQDPSYSEMKKYADLWGLDDPKIDYVYNAMKQYQKSVQDYQAKIGALQAQGQNVEWDTVSKTLQQLANQTQQSLQNYLGQDSFAKLERNHVLMFTGVRPSQ